MIPSLVLAMAFANPGYSSGSTGADGAIFVGTGTSLAFPLPPDGIIHATTVTVEAGGTLTFTPNAQNTPVFLLASGDVTIDGDLNVNGQPGTPVAGGSGGPGGFRGGLPGTGPGFNSLHGGAGHGPGGSIPQTGPSSFNSSTPGECFIGSSAFHTSGGIEKSSRRPGANSYGTSQARGFTMIGGSGAGGVGSYKQGTSAPEVNCGGGGGGGALQIASSTRITVTGNVEAHGGGVDAACQAKSGPFLYCSDGSDGRIRLVAPVVEGSGTVSAFKPGAHADGGSVRIDTIRPTVDPMDLTIQAPPGETRIEDILVTFPVGTETPRVRIDSFNGATLVDTDASQYVSVAPGTTMPVFATLRIVNPGNRNAWTLTASAYAKQQVTPVSAQGSCTVSNAATSATCIVQLTLQPLYVYEITAMAL